MIKYNWELTLEEFSLKNRAIRSPQFCEDYYRMNKKHQIGCHYYLYLDEDLNVINPYTKKDENKKVLKGFVSTSSREDVLSQAYEFIIIYAKQEGLIQ